MPDLVITPEHLDHLAAIQNQASQSAYGARSTGPTAQQVLNDLVLSHGSYFTLSSAFFSRAVRMRNHAIEVHATATADLAAKLRGARAAYEVVDQQLAENLDKQLNACPPDTSPNLAPES